MRPLALATATLLLLLALHAPGDAQEAALDPEEAFNRAIQLAQAGDDAAAVAVLEQVRDRGEAPAPLLALLGALYVESNRPLEALEVLRPLAERENADPAVLYNAGRAALRLNRSQLAEMFLARAVEQQPRSPAARELGVLWARMGRFVDAYLHLRPWARLHPEDTEARLVAALCAVQLRRPNEAEELLSDLSQEEPKVRLLWGQLLLIKADPWGALATLKPLLEQPPAAMEKDIRRSMAEAYAAVGQASEAVAVLKGHVSGNPSAALQLGQAQYQSGDLEGALATLEPFAAKALESLADAPAASGGPLSLIVEYGRLLVTAGRHQEALPFLEQATRLDPDNKQSWHQLGQALVAGGRREEAQAALARFQEIVRNEVPQTVRDVQLEKDLEDPTGRELREALTLVSAGRTEEALAIVRREMALATEDLRPRLVEARVLLLGGRPGGALEAAETALQAAPGNPDAVYLRGTIWMNMGELEAAEADYRQALDAAPDHTAAMNDLAVLLMETGRNEEARALLERALELRPDDELAATNLERLRSE